VIVVTHEPEVAAYTPRVLKFRDGVCIEDGLAALGGEPA